VSGRRLLAAAALVLHAAGAGAAPRTGVLSLRARINGKPVPLTVAPGTSVSIAGWTLLVTAMPEPLASVDARMRADDFPAVGVSFPAEDADRELLLGQFVVRRASPGFSYEAGHQTFGPIELQNASAAPATLTFVCGGAGKVDGYCVFALRTSIPGAEGR
jgi:hypothetical protein